MGAISGKIGSIYMKTDAVATAFVDEAMTNSGDNTVYYITNDVKRYWDKNTAVTVEVDTVAETDIIIDYVGGRITFNTPLTGTEVVTVSGSYWTVAEVAGFYNWSLDVSADMEDSTTFADNGWRVFTPTLKGFNVSAEAYWQNGDFLDRLAEEVIVSLYTNEASDLRYEGYAYITSTSVETGAEGLVEESVEYTGNGELYYYSV